MSAFMVLSSVMVLLSKIHWIALYRKPPGIKDYGLPHM